MKKRDQIALLVLTLIAIFFLWPYPVLYPLKLLVVFFHEASHALMTVATGGSVVEMVINPEQGGHVLSRGGNRILTLTAGYLGSLLWGAALYLLAVRSRYDKGIMVLLGVTIIGICLFFIRDLFAIGFCVATGAIMVGLGMKASIAVNDIVLRVVGLTSMLYAPLDIYSDTIDRSELRSDAVMLAEVIGGTGIMWGVIWLAISVALIFFTLRLGLKVAPSQAASTTRTGWY